MNQFFMALALLTALVLSGVYVYLVASVYPWLTLRVTWRRRRPLRDRGVRRVCFPEGRGVIYYPDLRVRAYVPKYALFSLKGRKYVRLMVDPRVNFIRYDVVTFDRRGRLLDVLEVSERLVSTGSTRAVRLPTATAYASVIPRQVDGEYRSREAVLGYSPVGIGVFVGLTILTTLLFAFFIQSEIPRLMYLDREVPHFFNGRMTLLASVILGAISSLWVLLTHHLHAKRRIHS